MARPKSDIERIQAGLRLRPEIIKAMKHLSVDTEKPLNLLFEEAAEAYLQSLGIPLQETEAAKGEKEEPPR